MYQLLHFTNSAGTFYFMADEFAQQSEHIELCGEVAYIHSATPTVCKPPVFAGV